MKLESLNEQVVSTGIPVSPGSTTDREFVQALVNIRKALITPTEKASTELVNLGILPIK